MLEEVVGPGLDHDRLAGLQVAEGSLKGRLGVDPDDIRPGTGWRTQRWCKARRIATQEAALLKRFEPQERVSLSADLSAREQPSYQWIASHGASPQRVNTPPLNGGAGFVGSIDNAVETHIIT